MASHPLDNPIWQALTTCHADFAIGNSRAKRYPTEFGPFVAVASADAATEADLAALVDVGESVYVVDVAPRLTSRWQVEEHIPILQMACPARIEEADNQTAICDLSTPDIPAMLALTALVYPEFFRARTLELGKYLGIHQHGNLAAMAGERFYVTGHREISAVCTHPDFVGRGYAAALIARLVNSILDRNEIPFLHVSSDNERAKSLYERLGFITRRALPLWQIQRQR